MLKKINLFYCGKKFDVTIAKDKEEYQKEKENNKDKKLLVLDLTKDITSLELTEYFQTFGKISNSYVAYDVTNKATPLH